MPTQPREFEPPDGMFVVLTRDAETIAGGGFVRLADGVAEIKRMWTSPDHRRRGCARVVLSELERRGVRRVRAGAAANG